MRSSAASDNDPSAPSDVFAGDLNRDGRLDLLTSNNAIVAYLNLGHGTFPDGGARVQTPSGSDNVHVVAADFNGDGILDFVTQFCSSGGLTLDVQFGNGDGTFHETRDYDIAFPDPPFVSSCLDALGIITMAGEKLQSIIASTMDQQITIFRNDGTGFFPQQQMINGSNGMKYSGVSTGDYNGDGFQDVAAVEIDPDGVTRRVVIFYQHADKTFAPPVSIFSSQDGLVFTHTVDLNGDTKGDLLVSFFGGPSRQAGVVAFTNLGGGSFHSTVLTVDPFYTIAGPKPASIHPVGKAAGLRGILLPLTQDPTIGGAEPVIALFPAQSTGWGSPIYLGVPGGTGPQAVANGDFNGDGRPDFAAVDNNNRLLIFLNTTTASTCPYPTGSAVSICSPAAGATLSSTTVPIHASANSGIDVPIDSMVARIDGTQVASNDMATLDASVTVKTGTHTLEIEAVDAEGNHHIRDVNFTVQ